MARKKAETSAPDNAADELPMQEQQTSTKDRDAPEGQEEAQQHEDAGAAPAWKPVRGELCRYTIMRNGPRYEARDATIVKVHDDGELLDLDVDMPNGEQRIKAVRRGGPEQAGTWSPPAR